MEAYQKLKSIFNGLTRAHGVFYKGETKDSGKVGGKAFIMILVLVLSPYVMMLLALGLVLMLTITL
jgi:hypothetical protein